MDWRRSEKCRWRNLSAASTESSDDRRVEPTMSVNKTVTFSPAAAISILPSISEMQAK